MSEGQYGHYLDATVGEYRSFTRPVGGTVVEVGENYLIIEDDASGEEIVIDNDWEEL